LGLFVYTVEATMTPNSLKRLTHCHLPTYVQKLNYILTEVASRNNWMKHLTQKLSKLYNGENCFYTWHEKVKRLLTCGVGKILACGIKREESEEEIN
jgi:hypothetical protein